MGKAVPHKIQSSENWSNTFYFNFFFEHVPNLIFNDTQIKFVEDHKHLGLTFSSKGKWYKHR